jgi:hypothetical protein
MMNEGGCGVREDAAVGVVWVVSLSACGVA